MYKVKELELKNWLNSLERLLKDYEPKTNDQLKAMKFGLRSISEIKQYTNPKQDGPI
jgi:hypothetical protein